MWMECLIFELRLLRYLVLWIAFRNKLNNCQLAIDQILCAKLNWPQILFPKTNCFFFLSKHELAQLHIKKGTKSRWMALMKSMGHYANQAQTSSFLFFGFSVLSRYCFYHPKILVILRAVFFEKITDCWEINPLRLLSRHGALPILVDL